LSAGSAVESFSAAVTRDRHAEKKLTKPRLSRVASGYVGILSFDLHFSRRARLSRASGRELLSLKSDLQRRTGAAIAEVDHHELWQRCAP